MGQKARLTCFALSLLAGLGISALGAVWAGDGSSDQVAASQGIPSQPLTGKMLVANPRMHDPRFAKSVVYIVDHDETGTFGLIVNKPFGTGPLDKFLSGFGINAGEADPTEDLKLVFGGPVETDSLFLLHSPDYQGPGTVVIDGRIGITARIDALRDLASGNGPDRFMMAVGYAGWAPGQLLDELDRGDWSVIPAETDLIFSQKGMLDKWRAAREALGRAL